MCHCLFGHENEDDAEVIYGPATGVCPSWDSAAEEIRRWQERWYGNGEHSDGLRQVRGGD